MGTFGSMFGGSIHPGQSIEMNVLGGCASGAGQRQGDEIEGPRSGPHQRRSFAERVAPLSHLWTARRSCHGQPGALPTGLTALTPARGLHRMDLFLSFG